MDYARKLKIFQKRDNLVPRYILSRTVNENNFLDRNYFLIIIEGIFKGKSNVDILYCVTPIT